MKVTIPDDWNGEDWHCIKIEWPDSPGYDALLRGFLSQFTRGRFWKETTGSIKDAQEIGWAIFDENWPFRPCEECGGNDPVNCPTCQRAAGECSISYEESEDFDMPCMDLTSYIKIENGKLYVKNGCCEWIEIGDLSDVTSDIGDQPLNPGNDPDTDYYACGKATAVIQAIYDVIALAWDMVETELESPWAWPHSFKTAFPAWEGGQTWFIDAVLAAIQADLLTDRSYAEDPSKRAKWLCDLENRLTDDATGITSDDWSWLITHSYDIFPASANLVLNPLIGNLIAYCVQAIGQGDLNNVAKLGATTPGSCGDCGTLLGERQYFVDIGMGMDWSHVFDLRLTLPASITLIGNNPHWASGQGVWGDPGVVDDGSDCGVSIAFDTHDGSGTIKRLGVAWKTVGDEVWSGDTTFGVGSHELANEAEIISACGDSPSTPGTFTLTKACLQILDAGEDHLQAQIVAAHPPDENPDPDISISTVLVAIAIAGTGTDPIA